MDYKNVLCAYECLSFLHSLQCGMHLHSRRTDCDKSDLNHHLYCTCVALNIFSVHIAFIYTLPQTCSYQHLFNQITVILDIKHISNIDFFKSTFLHVCEPILVRLLCLSYTTRTEQIFICLGQGGRWTALRHTLNPPSAAASFRIVRNTGHRKAREPHTQNKQNGFSSRKSSTNTKNDRCQVWVIVLLYRSLF